MFLISKAYKSICDFLVIFRYDSEPDSSAARHLVYKPDTVLIEQLENFIQRQVFVENEDPRKILKKVKYVNIYLFFLFSRSFK